MDDTDTTPNRSRDVAETSKSSDENVSERKKIIAKKKKKQKKNYF